MLQYSMPKRKSIKAPRKPTDPNVAAFNIVQQVTGETTKEKITTKDILSSDIAKKAIKEGKNPFAAFLGQRGGKKGGDARKIALTPERRKEIASEAAKARWARNKKKEQKSR